MNGRSAPSKSTCSVHTETSSSSRSLPHFSVVSPTISDTCIAMGAEPQAHALPPEPCKHENKRRYPHETIDADFLCRKARTIISQQQSTLRNVVLLPRTHVQPSPDLSGRTGPGCPTRTRRRLTCTRPTGKGSRRSREALRIEGPDEADAGEC